MGNFKAIVKEFLRNRDQRDIKFRMNQSNVALIKCRFDDETDFVYMTHCYGDGDPVAKSMYTSNAPKYAGIYSVTKDKVICPDCYFGLCCEAEDGVAFRKEIVSEVTRRIIELVNSSPVDVADGSCRFDNRIDYYAREGAHAEALRWYFDESIPHDYCPKFDQDEWLSAKYLVMALNHRDQCIDELANAYIVYYANRINNRLEELKLVRAEYDELIAQKGEHYYQKQIANAVKNTDIKTVQLEIVKDGKTFTTKYDASHLRHTGCCSYSVWHMPAASRYTFDQLCGHPTELLPSDIKRITYGRKVIYDADK